MSDKNILTFLAQEESGGASNKTLSTPDKYGSLGKYQLRLPLYTDIQKAFPEYRSIPFEKAALTPGLDDQVARAGLQVIMNQIAGIGVAPSPSLISTVWQQGIGSIQSAIQKALDSGGGDIGSYLGDLGQRRLNRSIKYFGQ